MGIKFFTLISNASKIIKNQKVLPGPAPSFLHCSVPVCCLCSVMMKENVAPKLKEIGVDWSDEEEEEDMEENVAAAAPLEADTASDALTHDSSDVVDAGSAQINKNEGSFIALLVLYCVDSEVCTGIVFSKSFPAVGLFTHVTSMNF